MVALIDEPDRRTAPGDHLVQVYRDAGELADAVSIYLGAGLEAGEPAVVVATAAHWPLFADRLEQRGWNVPELQAERMLAVADADDTLAAILEDGQPSPRRFNEVVGGLLDNASSGTFGRQRPRVFGEMVDLLCRRGDAAAAGALEELWNRLARRRSFLLLCGYEIDVFDRHSEVTLLPQVCRSHSHVLPAAAADRMDRAVDAALVAVLGSTDARKVQALAARHPDRQRIPASQLALMWVSAHMPRSAERVLATARTHYLAATPA